MAGLCEIGLRGVRVLRVGGDAFKVWRLMMLDRRRCTSEHIYEHDLTVAVVWGSKRAADIKTPAAAPSTGGSMMIRNVKSID